MSLLSVCSTYYRTSYICTTTNSLSFKKSHFGRSTELQIPQICKKNLVKYFGQIISLKKLTRNYTMFKKMSKNTNTGIIQTRDSNHTNLKLHFFSLNSRALWVPKLIKFCDLTLLSYDDFAIFEGNPNYYFFSSIQLNAYIPIFKDKEVFSNWSQNRKKL